jgi:hypothetical protein
MDIVKLAKPAPEFISMQPFMFKAQFIRKQNAFLVRWNDPNKHSLEIQLFERETQYSGDGLSCETLSLC